MMKVLIADDSRAILDRLADLLEDVAGVKVIGKAGSAMEAIRYIQEASPDAVVLDLQMPGGSGLDVLRAIRPDHPEIFVLICTNDSDPQLREECFSAGANAFLDKSAEFEKIPGIFLDLIRRSAKAA
jgi:DNA-binding NarL/FixJ family response regulator